MTRGRGVSIHRADCPNLLFLAHEPERRLEIDWQEAEGERFVVRLALEGERSSRTLRRRRRRGQRDRARTSGAWSSQTTDGKATGAVLVEVENLAHLQKIIKAARRVKGITEVRGASG